MIRGNERKLLMAVLIIFAAVAAIGMSGMGGGTGPQSIPAPSKNFSVTVVDRADVRTDVTKFSINGYTYFFGRRGKADMAVPFDKVRQADLAFQNDGLVLLLTLKDGGSVRLSADKRQECFGEADIGHFRISLGDIKSLIVNRQILPTPSGN